ncbi:bifunctional folylpolyglutamate synthase/dihydrofolate synthase [Antarcticibacterium sp. 1MA-6-2]|uniref:bifunctional folylpolyglutamate synthase/dihydrofolate synthase n=1 Tax=Antarcticibacterium sp. 1MA-6-2 TaxID=2908210 RepID=UPI001F327424|nr:folylpolyglutamate synthase/dihydrofolate synthase family protein [Antarcticibacterium sp. 1MA-6-2]UJH92977.1 bifunctional folylpolyglutamate synthase/dihydrofolate synthase [Antarcticibacterium sp. 1MA-6-2]
MFQQLPMYQRIGADAFKKDLTNILKFSEAIGSPDKKFRSIHVAGTNGKGSTSHMLASILQESGYKVGLYTSPHLKDYRERIKINGCNIPEEDVVAFITRNKVFLEAHKLSFFEMSVGMAFDHFAAMGVDIAVVEVGLGGRLDSTNIITPVLSLITNIGFDHTQMLGNTLPEIAGEKAGIIKPKIPVVISEKQIETEPVFRSIAKRNDSPITFAEDQPSASYNSDLKGNYQKKNIQAVVTAIRTLSKDFSVSEENIRTGLLNVKKNTGLRGRWDVLQESPKVICDTAHNAEGLQWVMNQLKEEEYVLLHIVMGVVNDKDLEKILPLFSNEAKYYFCKPDVPRGMEAAVLAEKASNFGLKGEVYSSVSKAYETALKIASSSDLIFVGGSTFTVAEII